MAEPRISGSPPDEPRDPAHDGNAVRDFAELRKLLVGSERYDLDELRSRLDDLEVTPEEIAEILPEAITRAMAQDDQLARALSPTIEGAIQESVEREPHRIADAIYPVLGPAIRRAIADTMAGIVSTINRAIEHSFSIQGIKWRLESWRTGVPYAQVVIKHALVYRVERIFLIHAQTGLVLAHEKAEDVEEQDSDVIAGMLTAIRDFVNDSFNEGEGSGDLRTFEVGERTVHVEQGPLAAVAAVVRGQPPIEFREHLQDTIALLHSRFGRAFREFDGDPEPFLPAAAVIAEHLETVVETDRPHRWGWASRSTWAIAGVAALLLIALWVRADRRWDGAVAALEAEPGIVVLDAERSWGRWHFAGLRDPASTHPGTILATRGVDTTRVTFAWEPYLSLDPALAAGRVRTTLRPPPSVMLEPAGDTVVASGSAPAPWLAAAYASRDRIPGVAFLDLGAVEPAFADTVAAMLRTVEHARVLFPVGLAAWTADGRAQIDTVAATADRLRRAADEAGFTMRIAVVGRTDSTGSRETNRALSLVRANAVVAALLARGIGANELQAEGIGTSAPLQTEDAETAARVNRSVSFAVRMLPAGRGGTAP